MNIYAISVFQRGSSRPQREVHPGLGRYFLVQKEASFRIARAGFHHPGALHRRLLSLSRPTELSPYRPLHPLHQLIQPLHPREPILSLVRRHVDHQPRLHYPDSPL